MNDEKTFPINAKDYICMTLALAAAAELISQHTGYSIEQIAVDLTYEANRRIAHIPPEGLEEIINSYFVGKELQAPATVSTINLKP